MNKNRKQKLSYIFISPNDKNALEALLCEAIVGRLAETASLPSAARDL